MALAAVFVAACGGGSGSDSEPATSSSPEVIEIPTRWASGNAATLASLTAISDEVFIGRVEALQEVSELPMAAGGADRGPRPDTFPVSRYSVSVERPVQGTLAAGDTVTIEQAGGPSTQPDGTPVILVLEADDPLAPGSRYLFFAQRKENGSFASPPFGRLLLGPGNTLDASQRWSQLGAMQELAGVTPDQAANAIEAIEAAGPQ
jgi:hypothetical protein